MKYYLIESEIKDGWSEYWNKFIISCETEAPDHAELEISVWNWTPRGKFDGRYFDDCERLVYDRIIDEIPESEIGIASKFLNEPIPFVFDKDFDPEEYCEKK
tara:strand:- start:5 stop:310 length:306 start_codon:yes stop_codon:yes gene_type:complete